MSFKTQHPKLLLLMCLVHVPCFAERGTVLELAYQHAKKPWHSYIKCIMYKSIQNELVKLLQQKASPKIKALLSIHVLSAQHFLYRTKIEDNVQLENKRYKRNIPPYIEMVFTQFTSQLVSKPLGYNFMRSIELERKLCNAEEMCFDMTISHIWKYHLHGLLRLNISFVYFYINFADADECELGHFTIYPSVHWHSEPEEYPFSVYCGRLPNYFHCPFFPQISVVLNTKLFTTFDVKSFYSVIESDQISAFVTHTSKENLIWSWHAYTYKSEDYLSINQISVRKFEKLLIELQHEIKMIVDVLDGPDTSSPILKPSLTFFITSFYETSSFSCIIMMYNTSQIKSLSYTTRVIDTNEALLLNGHSRIVYPYPACSRNAPVCAIQIRTPQDMYVNISIEQLVYNGKDNKLCNFAGLTVYDDLVDKHVLLC